MICYCLTYDDVEGEFIIRTGSGFQVQGHTIDYFVIVQFGQVHQDVDRVNGHRCEEQGKSHFGWNVFFQLNIKIVNEMPGRKQLIFSNKPLTQSISESLGQRTCSVLRPVNPLFH